MKVGNVKYDPKRDKCAVETVGFVDLKKALATGIIPSSLEDTDVNYNQIDNPAAILGKPSDVFDAFAMKSAINDYAASASKEEVE